MALETIEELCTKINELTEQYPEETDKIYDLTASALNLSPNAVGILEFECGMQRAEEIVQGVSDVTDRFIAYSNQVMDFLSENPDLPPDVAQSALHSVLCLGQAYTEKEFSDEEMQQCIQDYRETNRLITR